MHRFSHTFFFFLSFKIHKIGFGLGLTGSLEDSRRGDKVVMAIRGS